ncbi:hypothetical protein ACFUGD_07995 [Streptomyces sp. NPDC057217]|uniref:hypothetical protein n=1 Tax=Streptomyces sp. NPDC057217 TaxID=3346054 RepID=UPI00363A546E
MASADAVVYDVEKLGFEDVEQLFDRIASHLETTPPGASATLRFAEGRVREQLARRDAEPEPGWSVLSDLAQDWQFLRQVARGIAGGELRDDRTVVWKGPFAYIPYDTGTGEKVPESMLWWCEAAGSDLREPPLRGDAFGWSH